MSKGASRRQERSLMEEAEGLAELTREGQKIIDRRLVTQEEGQTGFNLKLQMEPEDFDDMRLSVALMTAKLSEMVQAVELQIQSAQLIKTLMTQQREVLRNVQRLAKTVGIDLEKYDDA